MNKVVLIDTRIPREVFREKVRLQLQVYTCRRPDLEEQMITKMWIL